MKGRCGGLIGYFGLEEWYGSLSIEIQDRIVEYFVNFTLTRENLLEDTIYRTDNTPVKLLTNIALNAVSSKNHSLADMLMMKAFELIATDEDAEYYGFLKDRIIEIKQYMPDQLDINECKGHILEIVRSQPGILQKNVKLLFSSDKEATVGHALSQLNREHKITRIKKGNSFELYCAPTG